MKVVSAASQALAAWVSLVKRHPVATNSLTGGTLCAASDALAQCLESGQKEEEWTMSRRRIASAGLIGAAFGGWVYPNAYAQLDAIWHGTHLTAVLKKSLVEIVTVGIFVNSVSMASRGLLVGRDMRDVLQHVRHEMPRVTANDARFWLPYNLMAFSLIPTALRPTTTAFMEATWQTYISWRSHDFDGQSPQNKSTSTRPPAVAALPNAYVATTSYHS
jgi:hypothetical protein